MKFTFRLIGPVGLTALLILLFLAGGDKDSAAAAGSIANDNVTAALPVSSVDPCTIALAPHVGMERIDQQIIRLQQKVRHAAEPVAHLERLGWLFVVKARASFDPGFYKLAEQCALCIESKKPSSTEAMLLRGHVLHNLHQFREAEALARELIAQRGLAFDYGLLGDVLMEQGKLTEAVNAYQNMMNQKPGPLAYSRAAHIRWLKGDLLGAIQLMEMTVRASDARNPESAAWARVRLALFELQAGDMSKASQLIAKSLALQPDYPPALLARGRILLAKGKHEEAVAPLRRAVQLNPLPEYQWTLIEALQEAGRADEATGVEQQLVQRGAVEDPRTFAQYLVTTGRDIATAQRLTEEELKTRADVFTLDAFAWTLRAAGRNKEAYTFSKRALAEGTRDARLFYHAGVIAAATGQNEEANDWFEKAAGIQQMLLPSERKQLTKAFTALQSQKATVASSQSN